MLRLLLRVRFLFLQSEKKKRDKHLGFVVCGLGFTVRRNKVEEDSIDEYPALHESLDRLDLEYRQDKSSDEQLRCGRAELSRHKNR